MTSIRKVLALGALALVAGLVGTQPVWAQLGRKATATPAPSSGSIVSLLSLSSGDAPIQTTALGQALGRPPVSQPIPGPVINN